MQDFAQFMAGVTVTHTGLEARPDKGQTWRFADGRQGIVAAVDVSGATVYVGPESFRVPRGDWAVVFGAAGLVPSPAVVTAPAPIDTAPLGFGERYPPGGPVSPPPPAPALPSTIDVPSPTPPEPHRSRRDRKR